MVDVRRMSRKQGPHHIPGLKSQQGATTASPGRMAEAGSKESGEKVVGIGDCR